MKDTIRLGKCVNSILNEVYVDDHRYIWDEDGLRKYVESHALMHTQTYIYTITERFFMANFLIALVMLGVEI